MYFKNNNWYLRYSFGLQFPKDIHRCSCYCRQPCSFLHFGMVSKNRRLTKESIFTLYIVFVLLFILFIYFHKDIHKKGLLSPLIYHLKNLLPINQGHYLAKSRNRVWLSMAHNAFILRRGHGLLTTYNLSIVKFIALAVIACNVIPSLMYIPDVHSFVWLSILIPAELRRH